MSDSDLCSINKKGNFLMWTWILYFLIDQIILTFQKVDKSSHHLFRCVALNFVFGIFVLRPPCLWKWKKAFEIRKYCDFLPTLLFDLLNIRFADFGFLQKWRSIEEKFQRPVSGTLILLKTPLTSSVLLKWIARASFRVFNILVE